MHEVVRHFRAQITGATTARRNRLADRAKRAVDQLRKQFKHKIDDMVRRDAKRHWGINEAERQGLEAQLRLAYQEALERLERSVQDLAADNTAEPDPSDRRDTRSS